MLAHTDLTIVYAAERLREMQDELESLTPLHWDELGENREILPLAIDWPLYHMIDANGRFSMITARCAGELVGYHASLVTRHAHCDLQTCSDVADFVVPWLPGRIWVLSRLLDHTIDTMRARGVRNFRFRVKTHKNFGKLLERKGFRLTELMYSMTLGADDGV